MTKKMGIAILGASSRSAMILDYLEEFPHQGFITGAYDLIPQRCKYLLEKYNLGEAVVYKTLEQALSDPKVQGAFIGTSDGAHAEPVRAALEAGKHVYCEKPMAINLEDCDTIIEAAKNAKSVFYLGMNLRHGPVHEKIHELIHNGSLGKVLTIEANEYYFGGRTYFRRWNRLRKMSGGLWITKACHDFDLLNWMAGAKPKRIYATSSLSHYKPNPRAGTHCRECQISLECPDYYNVEISEDIDRDSLLKISEEQTGQYRDLCLYNSDKDTFDNGIAVIDFENDIRATYTVNVVSARSTRQMRVMGTKASLEGDMEEGIINLWPRFTPDKIVYDVSGRINTGHGGADDPILNDFFHCCQTGEKPRSSWVDGRSSLQVGLGARESCDTGKPILF